MSTARIFGSSFVVTLICLGLAAWWGVGHPVGLGQALLICLILGVMEVSLSFDNAVVNASKLKEMNTFWRKMFLTVGMVIAVFGMRLVFPIAIVAVATGLNMVAVTEMALNDPNRYSDYLTGAHVQVASFGGVFLLMVFLNFLFDSEREVHWLGKLEERLAAIGKLDVLSAIVALGAILLTQSFLPLEERLTCVVAGVFGLMLYLLVDGLGKLFEQAEESEEGTTALLGAAATTDAVKKAGLMTFLYLEVLDASFSFDGVIGAFAITKDVVIIMLGLTIGAMFVRSLTIFLVEKGTLDNYVYLEHGAHYAIGALAVIMLVSTHQHIPEVVTGLIGVALIVAAFFSSLAFNKKNKTLVGPTGHPVTPGPGPS